MKITCHKHLISVETIQHTWCHSLIRPNQSIMSRIQRYTCEHSRPVRFTSDENWTVKFPPKYEINSRQVYLQAHGYFVFLRGNRRDFIPPEQGYNQLKLAAKCILEFDVPDMRYYLQFYYNWLDKFQPYFVHLINLPDLIHSTDS